MRRRLFRILINGLTLLSLLLCVATCVLWVRSYQARLTAGYRYGAHSSRANGLISDTGKLVVGEVRDPGSAGSGFCWRPGPASGPLAAGSWLLFRLPEADNPTLIVPHSWFAALFGVPVLIRLVRHFWMPAPARPGLCPTCGYDLRATPERCPECGAVPATKGIA